MNVNHDISEKVNEKLEAIEKYKQLDLKRESAIAEALNIHQLNNGVDLYKINLITKEINLLAAKHQLPQRKIVIDRMFLEYINKQ